MNRARRERERANIDPKVNPELDKDVVVKLDELYADRTLYARMCWKVRYVGGLQRPLHFGEVMEIINHRKILGDYPYNNNKVRQAVLTSAEAP